MGERSLFDFHQSQPSQGALRSRRMSQRVVTLDVREDIRNGREPIGRIMETVGRLRENEALRLVAPFEPLPLFRVLARFGFSHQSTHLESGDWEVMFQRPAIPRSNTEESPASRLPLRVECDARGLEPPEPLVRILDALTRLPSNAELRAHTDRRPMHLYAQLEQRGFVALSEQQADGSYVTSIRHA